MVGTVPLGIVVAEAGMIAKPCRDEIVLADVPRSALYPQIL